jgi:uncharacterized protein
MTVSLYQASVPVYIHMLESLSAILDKAAAYAEAKKIEPSVLIQSRLAPDMRPFSFQIKMASFAAWNGVARVAGLEEIGFEEDDTTFPQLKARLDKTLAFLKSVKPEQVDGKEERTVQIKMGGNVDTAFKGQAYLLHFAQLNFFFHVTTAYALLRHNGLDLGKRDFIGKLVTG